MDLKIRENEANPKISGFYKKKVCIELELKIEYPFKVSVQL